ncbi:MAG: alpha/beta fold hydrolase [Thermoplasmatales archaeon]|nr:MAG: alpha/beta fold hydrolase [Thermoplasmatales archaeon]
MFYYIHGYKSSPESNKGLIFKKKLGAVAIKYRDCEPENIVISDCLKRISDIIKNDKNVVLIGSSLGGYLAVETALIHPNVKKLILLNPAIVPPSTNLDNHKDMPRRILEEIRDKRLFKNRMNTKIIIFRGTEDDLIPDDWITKFAKVHEATVIFLHDDHRFSRNLTKLPIIISNLSKK